MGTTPTGVILKTTNGGTSWTQTSVAGSFFLDRVYMTGATGYAVGATSSFGGIVAKTTNGGTTWATTGFAPSTIVNNIWPFDANKVVAVSAGGNLYKTTDGGSNWTDKGTTFNGNEFYGLKFKNTNEGYACGVKGSGGLIASTIDGGETWTEVMNTAAKVLNAVEVIGERLFVVGEDGKILKAVLTTTVISETNNDCWVKVYPNPATDALYIAASNVKGAIEYAVYDLIGKEIARGTIAVGTDSIPIASMEKGIYTICLIAADRTQTMRFTKQ